MDNKNQEFNGASKMPSFKRFEQVFAQFAEQVGGAFSVKAGLDERDAVGIQSDFTKWFMGSFINPDKPSNMPSLGDLVEYAYVKSNFRTWNIEFRAMLTKTQSYYSAEVQVSCPILKKKDIRFELQRKTGNSKLPGKNKPLNVQKWLGFFLPYRILKSRGTRLGQPHILSFQDTALQNSFIATCNDQGDGEKLVQDPLFQKCLREYRSFDYLEIGYLDWVGKDKCHILEVKTSIGLSFGVQPLSEALELAKTCLTLLEEFNVLTENAD